MPVGPVGQTRKTICGNFVAVGVASGNVHHDRQLQLMMSVI